MGQAKLKVKFLALLAALFLISIGINIAWTVHTQQMQMETELREKGQALSQQMSAVWDFMAENQDHFEASTYSITGSYQGLHCAVAGRVIGKLFTLESDYVTRYVNFDPRNEEDRPDEFESEALTTFYSDSSVSEYYAVSEYGGSEVFRYLAPMKIEKACLECHGEPKGEIDVTGNAKEGWKIGQVGGAISIVIPMDLYRQALVQNVTQNVLFFVLLLVLLLVIVYQALTHLVTHPLSCIREGFERIQSGDLNVSLANAATSSEMTLLTDGFNRMARELSEVYVSMEDQVRDRTVQLEQANDVLERQRVQLEEVNERLRNENRYKSDFLAMTSHELRTPLTAIIAFVDMLSKEDGSQSEKRAEIYREIEGNSRNLLFMINDILEMSRFDAGKTQMDIEAIDVSDLVGLIRLTMTPLARQNDLAFTCVVDPHVPVIRGDFEKLRHCLENLVGNAIKFTPKQGSVFIRIGYCAESDEALFCVGDTGIGIAKKDQERIFERFVQVDSSASRKYKGTGLGLSLARQYAELHGGTLTVESELGKGSLFAVRIPANTTFCEVIRKEEKNEPEI